MALTLTSKLRSRIWPVSFCPFPLPRPRNIQQSTDTLMWEWSFSFLPLYRLTLFLFDQELRGEIFRRSSGNVAVLETNKKCLLNTNFVVPHWTCHCNQNNNISTRIALKRQQRWVRSRNENYWICRLRLRLARFHWLSIMKMHKSGNAASYSWQYSCKS